MNIEINVSQQPDGSLAPNPFGEGIAIVTINGDGTAVIMFAGSNQALVNFDETMTQVLNYTLFNPAADMVTQITVENIINHMRVVAQAPLLH